MGTAKVGGKGFFDTGFVVFDEVRELEQLVLAVGDRFQLSRVETIPQRTVNLDETCYGATAVFVDNTHTCSSSLRGVYCGNDIMGCGQQSVTTVWVRPISMRS